MRIWPLMMLVIAPTIAQSQIAVPLGNIYFVRQSVVNDGNDGKSPASEFKTMGALMGKMKPGDTAYVGPGLYHDMVMFSDLRDPVLGLTLIADSSGRITGDKPGRVIDTGSRPIDGKIFEPFAKGVYKTVFTKHAVVGVVEMDGPQYRYQGLRDRDELPPEAQSKLQTDYEIETVKKQPSTFFFDKKTNSLYIHTSDGKSPETHEIEFIEQSHGILFTNVPNSRVVGFTFRHMGDCGIGFFKGSDNGIAENNVVFGSRIGIRIRSSNHVLVSNNVVFRNENSGIYFLQGSKNGFAQGNLSYENVKGIRFSSESGTATVVDNILFENLERGLSIEEASGMVIRGNRLIGNKVSQLMIYKGDIFSSANCFSPTNKTQLIAAGLAGTGINFSTLSAYQSAFHADFDSRDSGCGPSPKKLDVSMLYPTMSTRPRFSNKAQHLHMSDGRLYH
jgi:parallel beta-helix repeat protein